MICEPTEHKLNIKKTVALSHARRQHTIFFNIIKTRTR